MTVFRPLDHRQPEQVIQERETYTTPLLPGFELSLAKLLAEADLLAQAQNGTEGDDE